VLPFRFTAVLLFCGAAVRKSLTATPLNRKTAARF